MVCDQLAPHALPCCHRTVTTVPRRARPGHAVPLPRIRRPRRRPPVAPEQHGLTSCSSLGQHAMVPPSDACVDYLQPCCAIPIPRITERPARTVGPAERHDAITPRVEGRATDDSLRGPEPEPGKAPIGDPSQVHSAPGDELHSLRDAADPGISARSVRGSFTARRGRNGRGLSCP
jgi:hypothetical protein